MLSEDTKVLELNQYHESDKTPFIIYSDLKSLIEKIHGCKNNPEKSSTEKVGEHIPSGFLMSTILPYKDIENKHGAYKGKHCMKKFCESLIEHVVKIINFGKKKMKLLTNEQQKSFQKAKICYICKKKFEDKYVKDKKYRKVRHHCHYKRKYRGAAISIYVI